MRRPASPARGAGNRLTRDLKALIIERAVQQGSDGRGRVRKREQTAGGMTLGQAWELYQQALKKLNRSKRLPVLPEQSGSCSWPQSIPSGYRRDAE